MRRVAVRSVMLAATWMVVSAPGCGSDLERSNVGSACTRTRDCMPNLDCVAGECRVSSDASAQDAAIDAQDAAIDASN